MKTYQEFIAEAKAPAIKKVKDAKTGYFDVMQGETKLGRIEHATLSGQKSWSYMGKGASGESIHLNKYLNANDVFKDIKAK